MRRGGPDAVLSVWVTQEQEGLKGERVHRNLLLFHNPDAQSSVWATPPCWNGRLSIESLFTAKAVAAGSRG